VQRNPPQKPLEKVAVQLDDKVQFVYEVAFAKKELEGLDVKTEFDLENKIEF
jgi:hypothetical protein